MEYLIRPTKLNMAANFVDNFIFRRGIVDKNDVQILKVWFIHLNVRYILFIIL